MHAHRQGLHRNGCRTLLALCLVFAGLSIVPVQQASAETVVCDEATLTVNAADMKAEDLIKEIGSACGIRMMLRGEVFTDDVFSVQFDNMPIRAGLDRILRTVNIPNHMLHFAENNGHTRVVEITLIGEKGGERELTAGTFSAEQKPRTAPVQSAPRLNPADTVLNTEPPAQAETLLPDPATAKTALELQREEELQEKFIDLLDEILDEHFENEDDIDTERVLQEYKQRLPEDMRDSIPAEVFEELELLSDDE